MKCSASPWSTPSRSSVKRPPRVSPEGRDLAPDIPWREAIGIRHRLVHAYFDIDRDVLWNTAVEAIPALQKQLESLHRGGE
jgi:uncharacterized protein with HEPN domain